MIRHARFDGHDLMHVVLAPTRDAGMHFLRQVKEQKDGWMIITDASSMQRLYGMRWEPQFRIWVLPGGEWAWPMARERLQVPTHVSATSVPTFTPSTF